MADSPSTVVPRKRSRIGEYLLVLVIIAVLVCAAFYQEQLSAFFSLHLWDKGAPGRTVEEFLSAGKKGDQAKTQSYLGSKDFQTLNKDGKWRGYFIVSQAGTMEFDFADLAPEGEPKAGEAEFMTMGKGAASVKAPDKSGKPVEYRLEMQDGSWKITEIRGGHTPPPKPSAPKPGSARPGAPRTAPPPPGAKR